MGKTESVPYAIQMNNADRQKNETFIYRSPLAQNVDIYTIGSNIGNLQTIIKKRMENPNADYLGVRRLNVQSNALETKFTWYKNSQVISDAQHFGSGMVHLKLLPEQKEFRNYSLKMLGIYSKNSIEYLVSDLACIMYDVASVPIYDTLGEEATMFAFNQTKMATCIVTANHVENLLKVKRAGKIPFLQNLIVPDLASVKPETIEGNKDQITFYSWAQVQEVGRTCGVQYPWANVTPDSIYAFSYTSGTTGEPKGAMISHRNITSIIPGVAQKIKNIVKPGDSHLSYLPMAHIMERAVFCTVSYLELKIGVYSGDALKIVDDAAFLKPSIFVTVPRLFSKVYDGIQKNVTDMPSDFKRNLFKKAVEAKLANLKSSGSVTHFIYDKLVFKKVREKLGGNVKLMLTGSAPIEGNMLNFLKVAFCCPIVEGYGQTEATAVEFLTDLYERRGGVVGGPQMQNEYKLVDVPELSYLNTDVDAQGNPSPRGEIWLRGPNIIPGYYLNEEKNKETFTPDGWLMSGDVGQILWPDLTLKIIDRKKNIFKLQQGEYIAPEKLENAYKLASPLVSELFVYGESLRTCIVGVVVMEKHNILKFAEQNGVKTSDDPEVLKNSPEFKKALLKVFADCGKKNKFNSLENMKDIYVETKPFADLGLTTTAFKLKRHEAKAHFKTQIDAMYENVGKEK